NAGITRKALLGHLAMKVLVVDDHALIREALSGVVSELINNAKVLYARDAHQALRQIAENPDIGLVVLDPHLPDRSGFDILSELREDRPEISVVIVSASEDREDISLALELGALGFIPKSAEREVMLHAFQLILSGGVYVPPEILRGRRTNPARASQSRHAHSPTDLGLTARQVEVLQHLMQGMSNKAICRAMGIAEPTVKNHITAVLKALGVSNRTEAVIAAGALGLRPARES
ncbi:MAG: response regulator, partial [Pirellulaceae bacterium]